MEKLLEVLRNFNPSIDFENEINLVTDGTIDSMDVVTLIGEIEDEFGIEITMEHVKQENFNSLKEIWNMIEEIRKM